MNINDTIFYDCMSQGGGAISFSGLNSSLFRVCAINCRTLNNQWNQFACITTNYSNKLEFFSISRCYNSTYGHSSICLKNGIQNISNTNSSMNRNIGRSGLIYVFPNTMNTIFCTFYNNSVTESICIELWGNSGHILRSNIINNNSPSSSGVVYVSWSATPNISDCVFFNNQNTLFYVYSWCSLRLISCVINHQYIIDSGISPIYSPTLFTYFTNTYSFYHYNTRFKLSNQLIICNADNILLKSQTHFFNRKYYKKYLVYALIYYS